DKKEFLLRDIAACESRIAVRSDSPAAGLSVAAPCLQLFAVSSSWRRLSPSVSALSARALPCKDVSAARTTHRQVILRRFFPCTSRRRDRRLRLRLRGHG